MEGIVEGKLDHSYKKIGIIGLGYVGLPLALKIVSKGFNVVGIDVDKNKIDMLKKGVSYLPDVDNLDIYSGISLKRLTVTENYKLIHGVDAIIICVPTPLTSDHTPDLSHLEQAVTEISKQIRKGQLVILESSSYPGTTREVVLPIIEKSLLKVGRDVFIGYSPERIDPGNKEYTLGLIPKLLSGITEECARRAYTLYSQIFDQVIMVSSTETAELAKLLENCYRFINISFMNEFAILCDAMKINVWEVIEAAKTKPYGYTAFYPSPGIGGHCIPIDPLYLTWKAKQFSAESQFIELSDKINNRMPKYIIERIKLLLSNKKGFESANILIYGVTYKRDIDDIRESSAIKIIHYLQQEGVKVCYHDPFVPSISIENNEIRSVDLTDELLKNVDCVVILTDHATLPLQQIINNASLVFDTRNVTKGLKDKSNIYQLGDGRMM